MLVPTHFTSVDGQSGQFIYIARGAYGVVWYAKWQCRYSCFFSKAFNTKRGEEIALKTIDLDLHEILKFERKSTTNHQWFLTSILRELLLLNYARHEHVGLKAELLFLEIFPSILSDNWVLASKNSRATFECVSGRLALAKRGRPGSGPTLEGRSLRCPGTRHKQLKEI